MAIDIEELKDKIESKAQECSEQSNKYRESKKDRELLNFSLGVVSGLEKAANILQEAIDAEEQEQKKQQEALDTIKEALSGFCPKL